MEKLVRGYEKIVLWFGICGEVGDKLLVTFCGIFRDIFMSNVPMSVGINI